MTKVGILLALCIVACAALPQQQPAQQQQQPDQQQNAKPASEGKRDQKGLLPDASADEIVEILSTREGATEFVNCVMFPKRCRDPRAKDIARLAPILFRTRGRCKGVKNLKCTADDEAKISFVIKKLQKDHGRLYTQLTRYLLSNSK